MLKSPELIDRCEQSLPFPALRAGQNAAALPDIQNTRDLRGIALDEVGICDLIYPIVVFDRAGHGQPTAATVSLSVGLAHDIKGTHMSRFLEVLDRHQAKVTMRELPALLAEIRKRLEANSARVEMEFTIFQERTAPVSGRQAPMNYRCAFIGESSATGDLSEVRVNVPVSTLCPCSKEISDYGAHNQRGYITISARANRAPGGEWWTLWIEDLIAVAEKSASAPIFPLLKRSDERHVTMQAYDNPVFVEDVVRNVAVRLRDDPRIAWFEVRAVNLESIHNHSAFAVVRSSLGQKRNGRKNHD